MASLLQFRDLTSESLVDRQISLYRIYAVDAQPHPSSLLLAQLIVSIFLTAVFNLLGCSIADRAAPIDGSYRFVERVIDGDTLALETGERIRLIGVDTPETKHPRKPVEDFGKEAAAFTRAW